MAMRRTFTLRGDDHSAAAYLEGLLELLQERSRERMALFEATKQSRAKLFQMKLLGELDGLQYATDIIQDILDGMPDEED